MAPCITVNDVVLIPAGSTALLKVASTSVKTLTAVSFLAGSVDTTIGHKPVVPSSSSTFLQLAKTDNRTIQSSCSGDR